MTRRGKWKQNLRAVVIAAAVVVLAILAYRKAGRLTGITDDGLASSLGSKVGLLGGKTAGCNRIDDDSRWRCAVESVNFENQTAVETYLVEQTSRGCWRGAQATTWPKAEPILETRRGAQYAEGCVDLGDLLAGHSPPPERQFGPDYKAD